MLYWVKVPGLEVGLGALSISVGLWVQDGEPQQSLAPFPKCMACPTYP